MPRSLFLLAALGFAAASGAEERAAESEACLVDEVWPEAGANQVPEFEVGYENGFFLRGIDPEESPFELRLNARIQLRHALFSRDERLWVDATGTERPIRSRNRFDIERARLLMSGYAFDPRLGYFLQLDGDTDGGDQVDFFDYYFSYRITDDSTIQIGKRKVSASRQWLLTAFETRLTDRPMANDFFRPDRTVGIWWVSERGPFAYELMIANGLNTAQTSLAELDDRLAFAASAHWDPLGPFGKGLTDFEFHERPVLRLGHSYATSDLQETPGRVLAEFDFVRLTLSLIHI